MFRLQTYDAISSTNEVVKTALREGEPEGLAVQAFAQTGGYGRQGRTWASPRGGLYLSLLLRPQVPMEQLPTLSLVAGLAVRRAVLSLISSELVEKILVKWPNDVVIAAALQPLSSQSSAPDSLSAPCSCGTRASRSDSPRSRKELSANLLRKSSSGGCGASAFFKLCGISLEAVGGGVCLGIGVNVLPPKEPLDVGGKNTPIYLAELGCVNIDAVRDAVLREVEAAYRAWQAEGFAPFVGEFCAADALSGSEVAVSDQRGAMLAAGKACGVDEQGHLLIDAGDGIELVSSGEAHLA